jgi:formylglycine-generating enzyme required for sulfatase activity
VSDIFISYASADRSRVKPLVDELKRRGWSVWWDPTILPGETWDDVIEAALTKARSVIVLWWRDSIKSQWVRTEADDARRRGILVPALLDDVIIPLAFRQIQAAKLVEWSGSFPNAEFDKLAQAVTEVLARDVPRASATAHPATAPLPVTRPGSLSRRTLAVVGVALLVGVAGLAWYFVASHRQASKSPEASRLSGQVSRGDSKTELPASRPPVSSSPIGFVVGPQPRDNLKDGLKYVLIPAGRFIMGCSPGDTECEGVEEPSSAEQIANGFWLGQTEVTQVAWKKVNGGGNPSHFKGDQLPVESVDWNQASAYCNAIGGRLPTEKEWEYAARAGTTGRRYGAIDAIAWYSANSGEMTHPVALKQANALGLYDMLGNVWEWTADNYDAEHRVLRGGSWVSDARNVRVSLRGRYEPTQRYTDMGFRCVGEFR